MDFDLNKRLGGFDVVKFRRGAFSFIRASGIDGGWCMEWREDTVAFHLFDGAESDEDWDVFHALLCNCLLVSTVFDASLHRDVALAYESFEKRLSDGASSAGDDEDRAVLNELRVRDEMREKAERHMKE